MSGSKREIDKLAHNKSGNVLLIEKKKIPPSINDVNEGSVLIMHIDGYGLYYIARYNNELQYLKFSGSL